MQVQLPLVDYGVKGCGYYGKQVRLPAVECSEIDTPHIGSEGTASDMTDQTIE